MEVLTLFYSRDRSETGDGEPRRKMRGSSDGFFSVLRYVVRPPFMDSYSPAKGHMKDRINILSHCHKGNASLMLWRDINAFSQTHDFRLLILLLLRITVAGSPLVLILRDAVVLPGCM